MGNSDRKNGPSEKDGTVKPRMVLSRSINIQTPGQRFCSNLVSTTKYSNIFTFMYRFLFQQYKDPSIIFFTVIAILQLIPDVSPSGRFTTLIPLLIILGISAVKEIYEDWVRQKADNATNARLVEILRDGRWTWVAWKELNVGDVVRVQMDAFIPADLVLVSSSEPESLCFIETSEMDGETDLKHRRALASTSRMTSESELTSYLRGIVKCDPPNKDIYSFNGTLRLSSFSIDDLLSLGPDQLLQRGAKLRNTGWAVGVVIYTGHETKLLKNLSLSAPSKTSSMMRALNKQKCILFAVFLVLCLSATGLSEYWISTYGDNHSYLGLAGFPTVNFGYNLMTYIVLFSSLVPISIQTTAEIVRFFQTLFINNDLEMYHATTDTPAHVRSSNLNEELGQVKYVFSDKTGTLTQNIMELLHCTIGGTVHSVGNASKNGTLFTDISSRNDMNSIYVQEFVTCLAVCNTVIPEKGETGVITYNAFSPDELALVEGAARLGWTLSSRTSDSVTVTVGGIEYRYQILHVLEFDNVRKRMSVIVRTPGNMIKLFCKGADKAIFERLQDLVPESGTRLQQKIRQDTKAHLDSFAREGFRTLCCAEAIIPNHIYEQWKEVYQKAATSMANRNEKLSEAANLIEANLLLLGASAIEDKLQENVPETIESLLQAGISVWMLTGDKLETATTIGYACRLLNPTMELLIMNEDSLEATREYVSRWLTNLSNTSSIEAVRIVGLAIETTSLKFALENDSLKKDFIQLCLKCKTVICCRVTPRQKADVVEAVTKETNAVTLAIGDGGNDVAMIQKAHVGVGISGKEGLQAVSASDYSIAQFSFLRRLLFVHGAANYHRMLNFILLSFFKNLLIYLVDFWFSIYSGWSGQSLFESWSLGFYNTFFTFAPPIVLGVLDRRFTSDVSFSHPQSYSPLAFIDFKAFWISIAKGVFGSAVIYWFTLEAFGNEVVWEDGEEDGYQILGNAMYTYVVQTVCFKAVLKMSTINWWSIFCLVGSFLLWLSWLLVSSFIPVGDFAGNGLMLMKSPVFWMGLFIVPLAILLPDILMKLVNEWIFKSHTDVVGEQGAIGERVVYRKRPQPSGIPCTNPSDYSMIEMNLERVQCETGLPNGLDDTKLPNP